MLAMSFVYKDLFKNTLQIKYCLGPFINNYDQMYIFIYKHVHILLAIGLPELCIPLSVLKKQIIQLITAQAN